MGEALWAFRAMTPQKGASHFNRMSNCELWAGGEAQGNEAFPFFLLPPATLGNGAPEVCEESWGPAPGAPVTTQPRLRETSRMAVEDSGHVSKVTSFKVGLA